VIHFGAIAGPAAASSLTSELLSHSDSRSDAVIDGHSPDRALCRLQFRAVLSGSGVAADCRCSGDARRNHTDDNISPKTQRIYEPATSPWSSDARLHCDADRTQKAKGRLLLRSLSSEAALDVAGWAQKARHSHPSHPSHPSHLSHPCSATPSHSSACSASKSR
jgi:hypothetical protein